jgi:hypothetical protein
MILPSLMTNSNSSPLTEQYLVSLFACRLNLVAEVVTIIFVMMQMLN